MKKILACLPIVLAGCTTIHFDNGPAKPSSVKIEKWHHIVALDLYEASEPVDLSKECGEKEWVTVKTEKSFINGLAGGVANNVGPIWYPKTATISCSE